MKPRSSDTHPDIERLQFALLRQHTLGQRLAQTIAQSNSIMALARRAIKSAHPDASEDELRVRILAQCYGPEIAERVRIVIEQRARKHHARG